MVNRLTKTAFVIAVLLANGNLASNLPKAEKQVQHNFITFAQSEDAEYAFNIVKQFKGKRLSLIKQVNNDPKQAANILETIVSDYKNQEMPIAAQQIQNRWYKKFQVDLTGKDNENAKEKDLHQHFQDLKKFVGSDKLEKRVKQVTGLGVKELERRVEAISNRGLRAMKANEYLKRIEKDWKPLQEYARKALNKEIRKRGKDAEKLAVKAIRDIMKKVDNNK